MSTTFKNLVFSGGGVLGIAYLGLLDSLYQHDLINNVERVAGTSAGAITACITSFNLPFLELKAIVDSLDYSNIPQKDASESARLSSDFRQEFERFFDNFDCVYRLIKKFGWYSSNYFYTWIQKQIASQFDPSLKMPPYTFADFKDPELHIDKRPFKDLYMVGTDVTNNTSTVFSYEHTPNMEVAEAVRISMSIPLFFESIKTNSASASPKTSPHVYSDGGLLWTYPITLFDEEDPLDATLGSLLRSQSVPAPVNTIVGFITNVISCATSTQYQIYKANPTSISRTIEINTGTVSIMNFNIKTNDDTYNFLYNQGYNTTEEFLKQYLTT